jgi:hypothetical protein
LEFKANVEKQIVIYTFERVDSKESGSFAESGCSVIDKGNWTCATSYATNGKAFKRAKERDDTNYCHFEKKLLGGWQLITNGNGFQAKSELSSNAVDSARSYLAASLKADIFKASDCRALLQKVNPVFLKKSHVNDAVLTLTLLYTSDTNVMNLVSNAGIKSFENSNGVKISQSILDELGDSPTPSKCGQVTAGIEGQIEGSRARLGVK